MDQVTVDWLFKILGSQALGKHLEQALPLGTPSSALLVKVDK